MFFKIVLTSLCFGCFQSNLPVVTKLPKTLEEVSGIVFDQKTNRFWMVNDSGNKPILYAVDFVGKIQKEIKVDAKNTDWEDLTTDDKGNIYIGDFGNNSNSRKHLRILKLKEKDLTDKSIDPVKISFYYPDQEKFPPKKEQRYFDCEAFFYFNNHLYLFTKSRVSDNPGRTNLYKIPAEKGHHKAEYLGSFNTCDDKGCWVTSADINASKNKVALLTEAGVYVFSNFKNDDFLKGNLSSYPFNSRTQKESVAFKNDSTLYVADEDSGYKGGYLYTFSIR